MNRIENAFKGKRAFIGFLTAGDPTFDASFDNIMAVVRAGADLVEIGIPFSDPIAEKTEIQAADLRALNAGMTTDRAFDLVKKVRRETDIPIVFVTYLNPVFKYGYDRFFAKCAEIGIDGIICPDLPFEEKSEAEIPAKAHGIAIISTIAPTSNEHIKQIAEQSDGFINIMSSSDVETARKYTKTPTVISLNSAKLADGVIANSEIVKIIGEHGENAAPLIFNYTKATAAAIHNS